jgi:hypothetical protein
MANKQGWAAQERSAQKKQAAKKAQQYVEMVESIVIRADGATFTKLKPGIAEGAEFGNSSYWHMFGKA